MRDGVRPAAEIYPPADGRPVPAIERTRRPAAAEAGAWHATPSISTVRGRRG
jgi:predicted acyl esterase